MNLSKIHTDKEKRTNKSSSEEDGAIFSVMHGGQYILELVCYSKHIENVFRNLFKPFKGTIRIILRKNIEKRLTQVKTFTWIKNVFKSSSSKNDLRRETIFFQSVVPNFFSFLMPKCFCTNFL